MLSLRYRNI